MAFAVWSSSPVGTFSGLTDGGEVTDCLRECIFLFFVTYKCSKTQLQLLMKHIGSNWLLLPSDYSAINKAAGKKKSALGVHKGFLFSLSLTADCREADLSQS